MSGAILAGLGLSALSALASPVTGMANIAGSVTVSQDTINFDPTFSVPAGATNTGSFATLTGGTVNDVLTGGPKYGAVSQPDFMTFNLANGQQINFDLSYIEKGNVDDSPFTLVQVGPNVLVGLAFDGSAYYTKTPSEATAFSEVLSTQLLVNGESVDQVLASVKAGNAIVGQTYSATFEAASPTPEPASWALLGGGLLFALWSARSRSRAAFARSTK